MNIKHHACNILFQESVSDQRRPAIESLAKLLNYLIDTGKDMIYESEIPKSDDKILSLDHFLSKEKQEKISIENMTFTDGRVEGLRKQLNLERELNKINIKDIEHLEKRDKHSQEEVAILRKGKMHLEKRLNRLKDEYAELEKEIDKLKANLQDDPPDNKYEKMTSMTQTETNPTPVSNTMLADKLTDIAEINALKNERDNLKIEKQHLEEALNCLKRKEYIKGKMYPC